jgi:hypothetical protein
LKRIIQNYSVTFNVVDFGLYQIRVVDDNGCTIIENDVLNASDPGPYLSYTARDSYREAHEKVSLQGGDFLAYMAWSRFYNLWMGEILSKGNHCVKWRTKMHKDNFA